MALTANPSREFAQSNRECTEKSSLDGTGVYSRAAPGSCCRGERSSRGRESSRARGAQGGEETEEGERLRAA
jgi:hypothetical protein